MDEKTFQLHQLGGLFCCASRGLVDGFECQQTGLARQLGSDLIPKTIKLLLNLGVVGTDGRHVRPDPGVVMDICQNEKVSGNDCVDDIGNSL